MILKKINYKNVLDLCCGTLNSIKHINKSERYVGVDTVKEVIEIARKRYPNSETDGEITWNRRWLHRAASNISGSGTVNRIDSVTSIRTLCLHRIKDDNTAGTDFVPLYHVYHPHGAELDDNSFSLSQTAPLAVLPILPPEAVVIKGVVKPKTSFLFILLIKSTPVVMLPH